MSQLKVWMIYGIAAFFTIHAGLCAAWADGHRSNNEAEHYEFSEHHKGDRETEHRHKGHEDEDDHDDEYHGVFEQNLTYMETCGGCHLAYPPDVLPARSWEKILSGAENHYGNTLALDQTAKRIISAYLSENAADQGRTERAGKVMRSLGNNTPMRVTEVPYIRKEHHEINQKIFNRESIRSFSNCSACHVTAEKGIFDDNYINIQK
ncbi:MAG: diheme cytochrome c [Thermodesulfobacteriota bacterium]|nr:diheme cytochrome c [Thermodesulfobacteriota bacterium]